MTSRIILLFSIAIFFPVRAASPFAGFYTGYIYQRISGAISAPEQPIGGVAFTILESGAINSTSDLNGTVADDGTISWNANATGFTIGKVAAGVISATTTLNNGATASTFRIEAKNTGPGTGETSSLGSRFAQLNPTKALRNMNRVRFAGDRFVAAGRGGAFGVSYDGINWTRSGVPTVLDLYDVAYGNGHYVVVGDSGARFSSTNGVDWVSNPAGNGPVAGVAFGNGKFATMTFTGSIGFSNDGMTWSGGSSFAPGGLVYGGIDFVNGEFVAWSGNQIAFSADASDWTKKGGLTPVGNITVNLAIHNKIAFGNGVYVLAGQQGLAVSTDGNGWSKAEKAPGIPFGNSASVVFGDGKFVVCDTADNLWVSTDARQWTRVDQIELNSMTHGNGRFVGVGNQMWTSNDGVVWILPMQDELRPDNREPGYIDPSSNSEVVGTYAEGPSGRYSFGKNGYLSWYQHQFAGGSGVGPRLTVETLRFGASMRYGEAPVIAGNHGAMVLAEDRQGVTFKLLPPVTTADLLYGAKGEEILVFVGTGGTIIYTKDYFRTNWAVASSGTPATLKHIAWYSRDKTGQPGVFVASGEQGTILTSPNGTSWTRQESGLETELVGSAYDRDLKRLLVAAADGTLLQSTNNGASWTRTTPLPVPSRLRYFRNSDPNFVTYGIDGGGDNGLFVGLVPATAEIPQAGRFTMGSPAAFTRATLTAITLANGRYVVVGDQIGASSTDGQNWTVLTNGFSPKGLAHGNGTFVAVASGRVIGTSGDGLHWQLRTNVVARDFNAILFAGGRFVAVGAAGAVAISEDGIEWSDKTKANSSVTYNDITYNAGTYMAAGTSGTVLISTNQGDSWLEKPTFISEIKGITYGNGRFVAVSLNGYSATSANGLEWQSKQYPYISPVENRPDFSEVAFAGGTFYAPTRLGEMYRSTDGLNWTRDFTGTGLELKGAIVGNGGVLFIANNEIYRLSVPDGGSPVITKNPAGTTVNEDGSVTLTAAGTGTDAEFTWLKDGAPVESGPRFSGEHSGTLTISPFLLEDAGRYEFVAANAFGSKASSAATVSVNPKAVIATQPKSSVEAIGSKVTLTVEATGESLGYQWFRNGAPISGATGANLEIPQLNAADAGDYYVEITNPVGIKASQHAALSVVSLPAGYVLDPAWPAANVVPSSLSVTTFQEDGKLLMAGVFTVNGVTKFLARINADGSLDSSFVGAQPDNQVRALQLLDDGKILIAGFFRNVNGQPRASLARLNADGTLDTSYNVAITSGTTVYTFKKRKDGKIWVGGSFTSLGLVPMKKLGLLNADATPDSTFKSINLGDYILTIHENEDGSLLLGGGPSLARGMVAKILADGKLDGTFPVGGNGPAAIGGQYSSPYVSEITPGPNGTYYLGGIFTHYNGVKHTMLARILANGELDTGFPDVLSADYAHDMRALVPLGDKLLIGGNYYLYNGTTNGQNLVLSDHAGVQQAAPTLPKFTGILEVYVRENNSLIVAGGFQGEDGKPRVLGRFTEGGGAELGLAIVQEPKSLKLKTGVPATLAVAATGKGTLTFQWKKNGEAISGETRPTLVFAAAAPENAGTYSVEVKDSDGVISSQSAVLSFDGAPSGGGFSDWAAGLGLPAGKNGLLDDADGDGVSNAAEYAFGTSPLEEGSKPQLEQKSVNVAAQAYPAVSYVRKKNATGVAIQIRASSSVTFNTTAQTVEVTPAEDLGNGLERVTVRSADPAPHAFFFEVKTGGN